MFSAIAVVACQPSESGDTAATSHAEIVTAPGGSCAAIDTGCLAEARDLSRIVTAASEALGVDVACRASLPNRIALANGGHYFGVAVRCSPAAEPSGAAASGFTQAMAAKGYHGYAFEGGVVIGSNTSRECRAASDGEKACQLAAQDTERLRGLVWASLGVTVECSSSALRRVDTTSGHYYVADVTCTPDGPPAASDRAAFDARMKAYGWNGFTLGNDGAIRGSTSSRDCASY